MEGVDRDRPTCRRLIGGGRRIREISDELAELIAVAARTTGRIPSADIVRLRGELVAVDESYRLAEAAVSRGLVGWVSTAQAAAQVGISPRAMRARCVAGTATGRKDRSRWLVRVPIRRPV